MLSWHPVWLVSFPPRVLVWVIKHDHLTNNPSCKIIVAIKTYGIFLRQKCKLKQQYITFSCKNLQSWQYQEPVLEKGEFSYNADGPHVGSFLKSHLTKSSNTNYGLSFGLAIPLLGTEPGKTSTRLLQYCNAMKQCNRRMDCGISPQCNTKQQF